MMKLLIFATILAVIALWLRFLRYWADQEVKAHAERREELQRALALTHDLSKRGAKGWQR
jgi:type II secretory pathway component PulJ